MAQERAQNFTAQHTARAISPDWSRSEDPAETTSKDKTYRLLDALLRTASDLYFWPDSLCSISDGYMEHQAKEDS